MQCTLYSCQVLMKLDFSWQIFEKYSNIKFHKHLFSGNRVVPCGPTDGRVDGRTDRHVEEANSSFPQFCKRA